MSHVVELNGTPKPPNSSKIPEYYIIGNCFRQQVQHHQDNLANDKLKRIAKEERKAALEAKKAKEAKKKQNNNKGDIITVNTITGSKNKKNLTMCGIAEVQIFFPFPL